MTLVVTGATGQLGRLVVEALLERGTPAADVVATGRDTARLADLAERGVQVRRADFDDPASLDAAFAGADRVVLVSGSEVGRRVPQHRAAVEAAERAGVGLLAYTSAPKADTTPMALAEEHRQTEEVIRASSVPWVLLRNSWYWENYTAQLPTYLEHGAVLGSAGEGRISGAARADYAEAAAAVLLAEEAPAGTTYELGGDEPATMADIAAEVAAATGREVVYRDLPVDEYAAALVAAGLPEGYARVLADTDTAIAGGALEVTSGDLARLLGRPATPLRDAVRAAVRHTGTTA